MGGDGNFLMTAIGLVVAAWTVAGAWAVLSGLEMRRRAARTIRNSARLGRLVEVAPAIPLVVRSDGRIDISSRLKSWLGLSGEVRHLSDLEGGEDSGVEQADLKLLTDNVRKAQRTGDGFDQTLYLSGTDRALRVRGSLADKQLYSNNAALLWFFDISESEREITKLASKTQEATHAFDSLSRLIERAPLPMWYRDEDLHLALVNSAYVAAVGAVDAAEVIGDGLELFEKHDGETPQAAAARALEEDAPRERFLPATIAGQRRQMRAVDLPLGNGGVAGFAVDEQELADLRADFSGFVEAQRAMLDTLSAAVAQFDEERTLIFANMPFRRLFSLVDEAALEGTEFDRLFDLMRDAGRLPEMRDYPAWRAECADWFRSPEVVEDNWHLGDGTHLRVLAQPTPDGGLLLIVEDRTEQVQLAKARDTLLRVRTATFDNLFEAIAVLGDDGRFKLWNRKFTEMWNADEDALDDHPRLDAFLGKLSDRLRSPGQISHILDRVRAASDQRKQKGGRLEFADGRVFDYGAIPLPDGNILFTMLDVSDSQRMEQALKERNEALVEADAIKGRFLANMAYELRTPLTSIGGFAELLASGIGGKLPDTAQEYVAAIAEASERLTGQIDTVLDFSQSEAGALPIVRREEVLKPILENLAGKYRASAEGKGIEFRLDCRDTAGRIACDARRLEQALGHVLENAVQYTGEGGTVLLYADGTRTKARIVVSDNGPGMDNRMQARVFDAFARLGSDGKKGGLGLPLARQLVKAHDGELNLLSEPGEGTVVTIELPRK